MKMMAATKKSEQTIQDFQYCEVCRRHHSQGRKHVYSRTHRDNINAIINKYGKKVKAAKPVLKHPVVDSGVNEENFWCYFCGCEVKKHDTTATATMKYGGFFRHLASQEHRQKTFSFWWDHRIEKSLKNSFLLTQEDYGSKQIGPTVEDLQKHKKQKTLPKGRVGANFDRSSSSGEEWLPSFGRVWQVGRRWKPWQQKRKGRTKASAAQSRPDFSSEEANGP
ncbi:CCDC84 [Branchiostoma lanceolatum]|uniref:CCDC84 protein n=1 Tax=Branchiostoma lanceolatum TaxID=7740 RepID=A0A8J9YUM6_BRALA|nr:CCDC84 [Branchiostoma lanceolatum]